MLSASRDLEDLALLPMRSKVIVTSDAPVVVSANHNPVLLFTESDRIWPNLTENDLNTESDVKIPNLTRNYRI